MMLPDEKLELVRETENVFRDFGHEGADVEQRKAILATAIIKMLDREGLSVGVAHGRTRIAAADFSRISQCGLGPIHRRSPDDDYQPAWPAR